jgi:adenylyltransferase/sulfurtransferase
MPTLRIPAPLRPYTGGQGEFTVQAETVSAALDEVVRRHPALRQHLFSEDGELRAFVNLFLNNEDIRHLQGVQTPLAENDKLILIPSIAGG